MRASCGPATPSPATARSARATGCGRRPGSATTYAHALDDDEKAQTVTGFVERALTFFAVHGITAKRLLTDNGFSYVKNRSLRELLASRQIHHLTTEPYRPRTNGKVE